MQETVQSGNADPPANRWRARRRCRYFSKNASGLIAVRLLSLVALNTIGRHASHRKFIFFTVEQLVHKYEDELAGTRRF